ITRLFGHSTPPAPDAYPCGLDPPAPAALSASLNALLPVPNPFCANQCMPSVEVLTHESWQTLRIFLQSPPHASNPMPFACKPSKPETRSPSERSAPSKDRAMV